MSVERTENIFDEAKSSAPDLSAAREEMYKVASIAKCGSYKEMIPHSIG